MANSAMTDAMTLGIGIEKYSAEIIKHVSPFDFFRLPEPGERNPWEGIFHISKEPYDDGGGAAIAAYQYGRCPFAK